MKTDNKIPLYGFNNLTKSLSFSLYRVHYLASNQAASDYHAYINEIYSSSHLEQLLTKVCHAIGGNVLNIASQDYTPQGASVTLMISEKAKPESLVAHLDKSHLCIHTYPEETVQDNIAIFRADIELSTCGIISPLKVLDYVIEAFSADVVDIDYRIRGMTRDQQGKKHFSDHDITQISDYLTSTTLEKYRSNDSVMTTNNLFHCKLARQTIDLKYHVYDCDSCFEINNMTLRDKEQITKRLTVEINELFISKLT